MSNTKMNPDFSMILAVEKFGKMKLACKMID
jgi:hypothetical protein